MDLGWVGLVVGLVLIVAVLALARGRGRLLEDAERSQRSAAGVDPAPSAGRRHDRRWERPVPTVEGVDLDGAPVVLDVAEQGRALAGEGMAVLVLMTTTCRSCVDLWAGLQDAGPVAGAPLLAVVTPGADVQPLSAVRDVATPGAPVLLSTTAWEAYDAPGAPWFVVLDAASGLIRYEGTRRSWAEAGELVAAARTP